MICILPHLIFPTSVVKLKILRGSPCVCGLGKCIILSSQKIFPQLRLCMASGGDGGIEAGFV